MDINQKLELLTRELQHLHEYFEENGHCLEVQWLAENLMRDIKDIYIVNNQQRAD